VGGRAAEITGKLCNMRSKLRERRERGYDTERSDGVMDGKMTGGGYGTKQFKFLVEIGPDSSR
jgi:hypothetical protein